MTICVFVPAGRVLRKAALAPGRDETQTIEMKKTSQY